MLPVSSWCPPPHPSFLSNSPSTNLVNNKKQTISSCFISVVSPYLTNDTINPAEYDDVIEDTLHQTRQIAIQNQSPKLMHQDISPEINPVEETLHKAHRTALIQLKSGNCESISTFQNILERSTPTKRSDCHSGEDLTTQHLFRCNAHPTYLCVGDLSLRTDLVLTHFLSTLPSFHYLHLLPPPSSTNQATPYACCPLKSHPDRTRVGSHHDQPSTAGGTLRFTTQKDVRDLALTQSYAGDPPCQLYRLSHANGFTIAVLYCV